MATTPSARSAAERGYPTRERAIVRLSDPVRLESSGRADGDARLSRLERNHSSLRTALVADKAAGVMSAVVQFVTAADYALDLEERLTELVDRPCRTGPTTRQSGGDGGRERRGRRRLTAILARLDAFENRLTKLETRQRRPPPFPITVIENVRFQTQGAVDECRRPWAHQNDTSRERGDQ